MKTKLFAFFLILLCTKQLLYSQENWQYLDGLSDQYLWKVYAQSPDTVYITGASSRYNGQGMIAKSTNGGISWTKTFTTANNLLKDIVFYDKDTGFVVGENGILLKTTNGGTDWQLKTSGTTQNLNAIALTRLNNIWAVGDGGVVIHSVDEGETWQKLDLQLTTKLNDIAFKGAIGFIVGTDGLTYQTENTGETWNNVDRSATDNYYWIRKSNQYFNTVFINDIIGYSASVGKLTNGGENVISIYKTIDNSTSWNKVYQFTSWNTNVEIDYFDLSAVNDTLIYLITGNVILKHYPTIIDGFKMAYTDRNVSFFQNVFQNKLIISSQMTPISDVELLDISGKKILLKKLNTNSNDVEVDLTKCQIGCYLAHITFSDKTHKSYKLLKQ